jgi:2-oxoglutarate ferredoxin oxidoreductase subunit alpha
VIAPGSVAECFPAAIQALNWAERYQGPVILLTEMSIAERNEDVAKPDLSAIKVENRLVSDGAFGNRRYQGREISPFPVPGTIGAAYTANASEHDEQGDTTHQPQVHIDQTERRFSKLKLLEDGTYESENTAASVAILPWGGSKGPARAAYLALREMDVDVAWYFTMYIHPMPPALLDELRSKDLVLVPELNYLGQLGSILRSYGVKAQSITQYTGLAFKESTLVERVQEAMAAESGKLVRA